MPYTLTSKIFAILVLICTCSFCMEIKQVTLVSEEWEDATNGDGTGFYWDLAKMVYAKSGIILIHQTAPYTRGVSLVKKGKVDGWVGSYYKEQEFAMYPKYHIDVDEVFCICKKDKMVDTLSVFNKNKKVAWIKGYAYHKYIDTPMDYTEIIDRVAGLNMIITGRIDAMLDAKEELDRAILKSGFNKSHFTLKKVMDLKLYIGFSNSARSKQLITIWDQNIELLFESGELQKFYEKYDYTDFPYEEFNK